jgi:lysophospholipid acyltransferase (LPLAT)-like uncharacterized protein
MHPPLAPTQLAPLLRLVDAVLRRTARCRVADPDHLVDAVRAGKRAIFVCRHGQLWPVLWAVRGTATRVMVSHSQDGELLARLLQAWGFSVSRGSSSEAGLSGARGALRALNDGIPVGLAIDGPRGPRGEVQEGALRLALRAAVPLIPLRVTGSGSWVLRRSWDHFQIPRPGGRLEVEVGPLVTVGAGPEGLAHAREELARRLAGTGVEGSANAVISSAVGAEGGQ